MKNLIHFLLCAVICLGLTACAGSTKKQDENYNRKKIYLTEEDALKFGVIDEIITDVDKLF